MQDFKGKIIIVTGGAKGIGKGICLSFAEAGGNVMCNDIDTEAGAELAEGAKQIGGDIQFFEGDVSNSAVCKALVEATIDRWGSLDVLCNNVGIQPLNSYLPAHELPEEIWDRIIDVNLKSRFLMTKYSVPEMKRRGAGVIINIASVQGLQSAHDIPAYAASKGGDLSLVRQLALDYAPDNIRVLAVNPGTIETPLVVEAAEVMGRSLAEHKEDLSKVHPLGRIGQPADIGNVVRFLASEEAGFMTGEYVNVDGGLMAKGAWA